MGSIRFRIVPHSPRVRRRTARHRVEYREFLFHAAYYNIHSPHVACSACVCLCAVLRVLCALCVLCVVCAVCWSACGEERANLAYPCAGGEMPCVPHRSPIVRLPSGASASPLAVCATAAQLAGAFFATVARLRASLRRNVSLRHRATAFRPAHGIHPPNAARCAWSGYLPSRPRSPRRRLPRPGGGLRSGPARRPASACALIAPAVLARRKRCRLHRLRVQCKSSSHNCADMAHNHCLSSLRLLCATFALRTTLAQ